VNPATEEIAVIDVPIADTWKAMEALVKKGKIRTIGVSNFTQEMIEKLWETWVYTGRPFVACEATKSGYSAEIKPAVNQIEAHPYFQQPAFLEWMQKNVRRRAHFLVV
jgi:L-glyceraldehyde reductase